jgi:hypothetical protein
MNTEGSAGQNAARRLEHIHQHLRRNTDTVGVTAAEPTP